MPRGVTINIGINSLNTDHYGDGYDILQSAENDARNMNALALKQGFGKDKIDSVKLIENPTADSVLTTIRNFAPKSDENPKTDEKFNPNIKPLESGDILLVSFAGHGSLVADVSSDETKPIENNLYDQTWCLYDRQIIDDELAQVWGLFDEGVRILLISDSCHGGTVLAYFAPNHDVFALVSHKKVFSISQCLTDNLAFLSTNIKKICNLEKERFRLYVGEKETVFGTKQDEMYSEVIKSLANDLKLKNQKEKTNAKSFKDFIKSPVISISACQDNEKAKDGNQNGAFTAAIKYVSYGTDSPKPATPVKFSGNYLDFFTEVKIKTQENYRFQNPNLTTIPENVLLEDWDKFLCKSVNKNLKSFMVRKPFEV